MQFQPSSHTGLRFEPVAQVNPHLTLQQLTWCAAHHPDPRIRQAAALQLNRLRMRAQWALANRGAALTGAGVALTATGVGAVVGVPILIERLVRTKNEKLLAGLDKVNEYRLKYKRCKSKLVANGKKAFPEDTRTGPFAKNCHVEYKKWKDGEAKAAVAATELKGKLAAKGQLDPDLEQDLVAVETMSEMSAAQERREDKERRKKHHKKKGKSDKEAATLAEADLAGADYSGEAEEGSMLPWIIGGVAVLGVLGVGGVILYQRRAAA